MRDEDMSIQEQSTVTVTQAALDQWRAYAEQTRGDMFTIRQIVAHGNKDAAVQLLGSVLDQSIIAGLSMEDAGANRPKHLPARPAPETYIEEEHE